MTVLSSSIGDISLGIWSKNHVTMDACHIWNLFKEHQSINWEHYWLCWSVANAVSRGIIGKHSVLWLIDVICCSQIRNFYESNFKLYVGSCCLSQYLQGSVHQWHCRVVMLTFALSQTTAPVHVLGILSESSHCRGVQSKFPWLQVLWAEDYIFYVNIIATSV